MNTELVSLLVKNRWRKYLIVFCLFIGIGLMFSVRHLFPVFLDLIANKLKHEHDFVIQSGMLSVRAEEPEKADYQYYFPLVSQNEKKQAVVPEEELQNKAQVEPVLEDNFIPIDFENGAAPITIVVDPEKSQYKDEGPIKMKFLPGDHCLFGDGHACVTEFTSPTGNKIIFMSIHSGMGGEADELRDLFEGTGINQGLFNEDEVLHNLQTLQGSEIRIKQGDQKITGLGLQAVARISPEYFSSYTSLPIEESLDFAIQHLSLDPELFKQDLLIIETCGWRLPDEGQVEGLENTSSSVYLGFVHFVGN